MKILFTDEAWEEYLYWQKYDKKIIKKINALIKEIKRTPFEGTGNPEPLKYDLSGYWSRRIDREHRIVYKIGNDLLSIVQCRYHY
ncbi:Txe/YoeB family addiction module toxin [Francisella sp. 19X1-34]|uniref:Txe/YoeB family addiction module toxin n=1 Tax=Francisella sp. 19X1-34 TaxID=3087177 RepID=UPI002E36C1DE|nr:Txe/YoeB family addiction module toxin [Francisella sp. 19X1-34]MED7789635.1 Txe/YoeB family addiction module toxin [Francisella sp. 19X1-34]